MDDTDLMLKKLGRKTMFNITDEEMPALREQYEVFMSHVQALDEIDTEGVIVTQQDVISSSYVEVRPSFNVDRRYYPS